jgi:hypothetical protein
VRRSLAALLLLATVGCDTAASPERVLRDYFRHLRAGRVAEAYALTTASYRSSHDLTAFALAVARQSTLEPASIKRGQTTLRVELVTSGGAPVRMRGPNADALRLDHDPLDYYDTRTPEVTLRSFALALRLARRERILFLMTPALRERYGVVWRDGETPLPDDLIQWGQRLEPELNRPDGLRSGLLQEVESSARAELSSGNVVGLIRTSDGWRVADLW